MSYQKPVVKSKIHNSEKVLSTSDKTQLEGKVADVNLYTGQNSNDTAAILEEQLGAIPGIVITPEGGGLFAGNKITITKPGAKKPLVINSNEKGATAANQAKAVKEWLKNNLTSQEKKILSGESGGGEQAP